MEKQEKRIRELEELVARLEARLTLYENAHTPPSKKSFPEKEDKNVSGRLGRPPGFEGCTRKQPKPDRTVVAFKKECDYCHSTLGEPMGFVTKIIEEIPKPQPITVTEFQLACYSCPHCGKQSVAEDEDCPKEGVFGNRTMAQVSLLKYCGRLPCKLVCKAMERDFGLVFTPSTVLSINERVASALEPEYNRVLKRIRSAPVLNVDETSFRVHGVNYWLWVFATPTDVIIVIRASRSKKVLEEVLGKTFGGVIVCDGWKTYSNFTQKLQRCWAHLLREAKFVARQEASAKPLQDFLKKLYYKLVKGLESNPIFEDRLRLYKSASNALECLVKQKWKGIETKELIELIRNGLKHWLTFVLIPRVEPTNNRAERALREHVVIRKIIGSLRTPKGVHSHEVITSVLHTWRLQSPEKESELRERLAQAIKEAK